MKRIEEAKIDQLPGRRLAPDETFNFKCHSGLACFNQCCRNLNLFLYPYDVLRLSRCLEIDTDAFIDRHVDIVLREDYYFPEVLLKMDENDERTCPFLTDGGCRVYTDRPDSCRTFPVEQGALFDAATGRHTVVHFFRPPDFCLGQHESTQWTVATFEQDQEAHRYHEMTLRWAAIRRLFDNDPWGDEGPRGSRAKMAFMATYNLDRFREFVFGSSFLKRYRVKPALQKKLRVSDSALLLFGFDWVLHFVWGRPGKNIRIKDRGRK
jgi:Fe-S-cluster containining protein